MIKKFIKSGLKINSLAKKEDRAMSILDYLFIILLIALILLPLLIFYF